MKIKAFLREGARYGMNVNTWKVGFKAAPVQGKKKIFLMKN